MDVVIREVAESGLNDPKNLMEMIREGERLAFLGRDLGVDEYREAEETEVPAPGLDWSH